MHKKSSSWGKNSKNLRRFHQNPVNQSQIWILKQKHWLILETSSQQQAFKTFKWKEILKVTPDNKNTIKNILLQDVKKFAGGSLRYFSENCVNTLNIHYILDIITNGII